MYYSQIWAYKNSKKDFFMSSTPITHRILMYYSLQEYLDNQGLKKRVLIFSETVLYVIITSEALHTNNDTDTLIRDIRDKLYSDL